MLHVRHCLQNFSWQHQLLDFFPPATSEHSERYRHALGAGDSSVFGASDSWSKGLRFKSRQERRENFLLQGQLSVPSLILVSVPPPCYRSSTWKFRSFCQKYRCQVTVKHACTLRKLVSSLVFSVFGFAWSDLTRSMVVWCVQNAAASRGTSHVTTKQRCKYTTLVDIKKKNSIKSYSHSFGITCKRRESAREKRIALCKRDQRQQRRRYKVYTRKVHVRHFVRNEN